MIKGSLVPPTAAAPEREIPWELEHTTYEEGRRFVDEQVSGPFGSWRHEHVFEPLEGARTAIIDIVRWEPPLGSIGERPRNVMVPRVIR